MNNGIMEKRIYPIVCQRLELQPYKKEFTKGLYNLTQQRETHRYNYIKPKSRNETKEYVSILCACDYQNPGIRLELAIVETETGQGYI